MPSWLTWLVIGVVAWTLVAVLATVFVGRFLRLAALRDKDEEVAEGRRPSSLPPVIATPQSLARSRWPSTSRRILIVDDDAALRMLLRTTLTADDFEVAEAEDVQRASDLARLWRPRVVVLDVSMPGIDGLSFCSELKRKPAYGAPVVVLLTGRELGQWEAAQAGADALLRKPFSPLELVGVIDRMTGAEEVEVSTEPGGGANEQILLYARDLARLVEIERMHRRVVQDAYLETVSALANALEAKDTGTRIHSLRVRDYAVQLTAAIEPSLLSDPSLEYGFLLHDVRKIGVPNELLGKPGVLSQDEFTVMQTHTLMGAEILGGVTFLHGEGIKIVRSHHERWDGSGYPDGLAGAAIPLSARIFALADAVDAMTGERPYRHPVSWDTATNEIVSESGRQFDPAIVDAFMKENQTLRRVYDHMVGSAA